MPIRRSRHPAGYAAIAAVAFACGWFTASWSKGRGGHGEVRSAAVASAAASAAPPSAAGPLLEEGDEMDGGDAHPRREGSVAGIASVDDLNRSALLAALNCSDSGQETKSQGCLAQLARFSLSDPQIRDTFLDYLAATRDPSRRQEVISAMTPSPLSTDQLAPLLAQIQSLREAEDPRIRAAGLVSLAQWDRSAAIERPLREGLDDADPDVVRAAMTAVSLSNARSDELKQTLLLLAGDSPPGSELRDAAVTALRDFSLDAREFAIYQHLAGSARLP
ncbi:HEAT repeat domain-containing protein [Lysobacter capsici]|uniref:HEAT repeat domain-containing protein n=1 Tax=Lysobacter capsici TaxID=435897 RepID=UPI001C001839|nr:HEAT repeat domain-containing protein [Lysobacter capsici]QWF16625.1 HEAT repeat domain-containing protein [Lysobacter capsici]